MQECQKWLYTAPLLLAIVLCQKIHKLTNVIIKKYILKLGTICNLICDSPQHNKIEHVASESPVHLSILPECHTLSFPSGPPEPTGAILPVSLQANFFTVKSQGPILFVSIALSVLQIID